MVNIQISPKNPPPHKINPLKSVQSEAKTLRKNPLNSKNPTKSTLCRDVNVVCRDVNVICKPNVFYKQQNSTPKPPHYQPLLNTILPNSKKSRRFLTKKPNFFLKK